MHAATNSRKCGQYIFELQPGRFIAIAAGAIPACRRLRQVVRCSNPKSECLAASSHWPRKLIDFSTASFYAVARDLTDLVKSGLRFSKKAVSASFASSERTCTLNS
jgi:hypothetical protein